MPVCKFVQEGKTIDYTPNADIAAGDVVVQGDWVGIALVAIPANTLGALAVEGVWEVPKANSTDAGYELSYGDSVFWDAADEEAKADSENGANKWLGTVVAAATTSATTCRVKLNGMPGVVGGMRFGVATVTGNLAIATGLSIVQSATATLHATPTMNAMHANILIPTQTGGNAGKITIEVTKPTAANDAMPTASSTPTPVGWMAIGIS